MTGPAASIPQRGPAGAALRGVRSVVRYLNAILGGEDYTRYLDHMRRNHPGRPALSEREYWRERHAASERDPKTRCC
ncbi:YbdD/YjiX family protein [Nocardia stercoris]|uniref:DUF466 domain-containing protein n=1 Tax=Nocardia stercoris TaxID=2483361 RepID=A0A3M2LEG4_9NOCA|nr:YbdD/YjiX family protein [Nocardia stercoris]RMI34973.1 DUF466 domain-containing protein [Nocardia stercoris]